MEKVLFVGPDDKVALVKQIIEAIPGLKIVGTDGNDNIEEILQEPQMSNVDGLVARLKPIFYNNAEDVRLFLKEINGMKQKDITALVNEWVKDKRISDYGNSRKGDLWAILNAVGLYNKSRQNWNRRVF